MKFETAKPVLNLANAVLEGDFAGALNLLMQYPLMGYGALAIGAALIWKACNAFTYS